MNYLFNLLIVTPLLFSGMSAWGQVLTGTSEAVELNFGYPILKAQDDLTFFDENQNQQIDPGEGCAIVFTLKNESAYPAQNVLVKPNLVNLKGDLTLPKSIKIGDLDAGASRKVEIGLLAQDTLVGGTANFSFVVFEGDNLESATITFAQKVGEGVAEKD
ncbi:MAG: hypothetical protein AAF804_16155 [Bacteroidota bacterium]